jgi:hypothetical protein
MRPLLLSLLLGLSVNAQTTLVTFQSSEGQTALLELYTSEGCSSCPRAETWLSRRKQSPGLWKDFVPVALHVDYWDHLGWRDPLAQRQFSERQHSYAERWRSDSVYTPEFVLNGREWRDWSGQAGVPKILEPRTGVLSVSSSDTNHWRASFSPFTRDEAKYSIHAAVLASDVSSDVKAGENRGRRLHHDFAVLTLIAAPLINTNHQAHGEFALGAQRNSEGQNLALAVWVTETGQLEPLQATGGWLGRPGSH